MRRRDLLMAAVTVAIAPASASGAQQSLPSIARIGVLMSTSRDPQGEQLIGAFRQKLRELGRSDGGDVRIDLRWGDGDIDRIRAHAAELVAAKPDAIVCFSVRVVRALYQQTREIPIVFVATNDPVGEGVVASFARPGGNLTGFTMYEFSVTGKLLELLKEVAPGMTRAAMLFNPENASASGYWKTLESVAPKIGVTLAALEVRDAATIEAAVSRFASEANGGLLLPPDATTRVYRRPIVALAAQLRLPAIYSNRSDVAAGGLMAYGPDLRAQFRGAASYVDRILKGEKPAELPVQAPTKFELVINLKTAKSLGLTVPPALLARADEVLE